MVGKLTFNNVRGALRSIRVIIETDQGTFDAGMPLDGAAAGNVVQVGFALLRPGAAADVNDVRRQVEDAAARGRIAYRKESHYGKR